MPTCNEQTPAPITLSQNDIRQYHNGAENWDNLCEISSLIYSVVLSYIAPFLSRIDSNWYSVEIKLGVPKDKKESTNLASEKRAPKEMLAVSEVILQSPIYGGMPVDRFAIQALLPLAVRMLLRVSHPDNDHVYWSEFHNPEYKLQLINGRTLVFFENIDRGVVKEYDPEKGTFKVHYLVDDARDTTTETGHIEEYTVEKLQEELAMDDFRCQAVGLGYLPAGVPLPQTGVDQTVKLCTCGFSKVHEFCGGGFTCGLIKTGE